MAWRGRGEGEGGEGSGGKRAWGLEGAALEKALAR